MVQPFVLDNDIHIIEEWNRNPDDVRQIIHLEELPEPFIGNPDALVVVLNLNPKWDGQRPYPHHQEWERFVRNNMEHRFPNDQFPFYYLNPELGDHPGRRWWRSRLGMLLDDGNDVQVAQRVFAIEYCGYRSARFRCGPIGLQGVEYRNELVQDAMERNAKIIIMQGVSQWCDAVEGLREYDHLFVLRSPQGASIKVETLCRPVQHADFDKILILLQGQ